MFMKQFSQDQLYTSHSQPHSTFSIALHAVSLSPILTATPTILLLPLPSSTAVSLSMCQWKDLDNQPSKAH